MIEPITIDANGKTVTVKMMDDSWIINQCAGGHPFKPRPGIVWKADEHCARLPIPGNEFSFFLQRMKDTYGNCAAIAWHGGYVLGHIVFLPKAEARAAHATGWEFFGPSQHDKSALVVLNTAFCSLSGHEFRRKGIGKAMVALMVSWAKKHLWQRIEVYDASGGLFPWDWFDVCIPPKPFWESQGFHVVNHRPSRHSEADFAAMLADNPRHDSEEQKEKQRIIGRLRAGVVDPSQIGSFDLRIEL